MYVIHLYTFAPHQLWGIYIVSIYRNVPAIAQPVRGTVAGERTLIGLLIDFRTSTLHSLLYGLLFLKDTDVKVQRPAIVPQHIYSINSQIFFRSHHLLPKRHIQC